MFCYQPNFFSETQEMTSEVFSRLIVSDHVVGRIKQIRVLRQRSRELDVLIKATPDPAQPMNAELPIVVRPSGSEIDSIQQERNAPS